MNPNLDPFRQPSSARIRLYLSLLLLLVLTVTLGGKREGDLGLRGTLRRSAFARGMFADIGAISTLGALYLVVNGRTPVRVPAAIATLFAGSFALLPALAYEDWQALQRGQGQR